MIYRIFTIISRYSWKKKVDSSKNRNIKKSRRNKLIKILAKSKSWNLLESKNFIKV